MKSKPKTILIADDTETFLISVNALLRRMGFKVIPAENGLEVLKLVRILTPDVVVLDVSMPVMNGITVLKRIKNDTGLSHVPVIMISDSSDKNMHNKCTMLGCSGFLTKPIKIKALHSALQQCIRFPNGKRRKYLRIQFGEKVSLIHKGISEKHRALTLSEKGIFIRKKDPLPVGEKVEIALPLKEKGEVSLKGTVIYQKNHSHEIPTLVPGMAIEFKRLDRRKSALLKSFITRILAGSNLESEKALLSA